MLTSSKVFEDTGGKEKNPSFNFTIYFYLSPLQYHLHSDHSNQGCRVILLQEYNEYIAFATRF